MSWRSRSVLRPTPQKGAASGHLLASVSESSSVIACNNGVAQQAIPGRALLRQQRVDSSSGTFRLRVPATVYPRVGSSNAVLQLLLDDNDNGRCDDGEPHASTVIERAPRSAVRIELLRNACGHAL